MKPWLAYTRVSTEDQAREGVSLDAQRQSCLTFAAAFQWKVGEVVVDPGCSAKDLDRPGIQRVLHQVDAGTLAGVVVYKLDRLTRNLRDLLDLLERFDRSGTALVSVCEKLDTGSPMGRFFVSLIGAIAQWERETIADRVQVAMRHRKAQGGFVGGPVPAGMQVIGEKGKRELQVDPAWGGVVKIVWPGIIAGMSLNQVAEQLNAAGLPTGRTGCRWQATTVRKVALNPRYVGMLCTADDQAAAKKALASRFNPKHTDRPSHSRTSHSLRVWPLSGIAKCGVCGGNLVGVTNQNANGRVYHWYRCNRRQHHGRAVCTFKDIRAEPWERAVVEFLIRGAGTAGDLAPRLRDYAARAREAAAPLQARHDDLVMRRDKAAAEVARLVELAATGGAAANAIAGPLASRQEAFEELSVSLRGVEAEMAASSLSVDQAEQMLGLLRDRITKLAEEPPEEQALSIRMLVREVTLKPVDKQKGEVDLSINLPRLLGTGVQFVRQCPVVEVGALRTENYLPGVRWGGVVVLL